MVSRPREAQALGVEPTIDTAERPRALRRMDDGRLIAGVCAGLADYFDLDVVLVRVAVAALVLVGGAGIPLYLAAWVLVPDEETDESITERLLGDVRSSCTCAPGPHRWGRRGEEPDAEAS